MPSLFKLAVFFFIVVYVKGDDIDNNLRKGVMLKLLREMVNQTNSDSLNLPANSTSIRENITDTFKCENRTYGYYADVDNDCQIFHVCLTSQTYSGRNVTYRWSFICPNETIFNQEVLTCTRPRDAIDCKDSPMYYDVNNDIGKITNDTENQPTSDKEETTSNAGKRKINSNVEMIKVNNRKKQVNRKKQNIIQNLMKEVVTDVINEEQIEELYSPEVEETVIMNDEVLPIAVEEVNPVMVELKPTEIVGLPVAVKEVTEVDPMNVVDVKPVIVDEIKPIIREIEMKKEKKVLNKEEKEENSKSNMERSLKRRGKKFSRGSFRFKTDGY